MVPKHFKKQTKEWFQSVIDQYELEEHHTRILTLACEAWERSQEARITLNKLGMVNTAGLVRFAVEHGLVNRA